MLTVRYYLMFHSTNNNKLFLPAQVSAYICPSDPFPQTATVRVQEPEYLPRSPASAIFFHPPPPKLFEVANYDQGWMDQSRAPLPLPPPLPDGDDDDLMDDEDDDL